MVFPREKKNKKLNKKEERPRKASQEETVDNQYYKSSSIAHMIAHKTQENFVSYLVFCYVLYQKKPQIKQKSLNKKTIQKLG